MFLLILNGIWIWGVLGSIPARRTYRNLKQRTMRWRTRTNQGGSDDASGRNERSDQRQKLRMLQTSRDLHDEGRLWKPPLRHQKSTLTLTTRKIFNYNSYCGKGKRTTRTFHTHLLENRADPHLETWVRPRDTRPRLSTQAKVRKGRLTVE